ncbi:MAG TPA: phosphotransferase family protein [Tepidiformaceae bacterium]|nr:phosphotransferase family protein [Tepidiformaceae bacterium]
MDLDELEDRLVVFTRSMSGDPFARVSDLEKTSGHAGFSYFFDVEANGERRSLFLRLPPPGVKLEGTADVLRQVTVLNALEGTSVPHAPVVWSGDDPQWFGVPYFITPKLPGDVLRGDYLLQFDEDQRREMARQAMTALAGIHRVDAAKCSYLGDFWGFEFDVTRWDRFYERAADQHLLALQPKVRQRLLDTIPHEARIGLYHGDFQWANLLYAEDARLQAVIDWELCGIGASLNDVGWICAFNEPRAWAHEGATGGGLMPQADELEAMYREAWGADAGDIRWFKALAVYKFGIITGFNLMLHRRGKRDDPHWEDIAPSMETNMAYAMEMLG